MAIRAIARAVVTSVTALALVSTSGAGVAAADVVQTVTLPTPDVEYLLPGCTTEMSWLPSMTPVVRSSAENEDATGFERIDVTETGWMRVVSTGCGPVVWEAKVTILDAPIVSGRAHSVGNGSSGNPASTSVSQAVLYGIGEREAGNVTFSFSARSRLGEVCLGDKWTFDAATKRAARVGAMPCGTFPTALSGSD
ncbi:MAG TPA: hypothetical protein VNA20_17750 [Frankiaceae bacterium]|nr:hypothetical protein [Frankiaceae bacterium]